MVDFSQILLRQCTLSYRRLAPKFQHSLSVVGYSRYLSLWPASTILGHQKILLLSGWWNGWCESNPGMPFSHSWALADFFDIADSKNVDSGKVNENGNSGTIPPAELNIFLYAFRYRQKFTGLFL